MQLSVFIEQRRDTSVTVNGHRVNLGRNPWEHVTMDELTDRFARTCRELGATPIVTNPVHNVVWTLAERPDGMVDMYSVFTRAGMVEAMYGGTVTPAGERIER